MGTEYELFQQEAPTGGLDVSRPESQLPHGNIPDGQNVLIKDGLIQKREGYTQLLAGISGISTGRVMEGDEYGDASGTNHFLIVTTDKIIEYVSGGPTWTDRTGGGLTATSDDAVFMSPVGGASLDNLYITNGVDNVKVWTGSGNVADLTTTGFTTFKSKCLLGFKGHLIHGNVTEDGNVFPYRIRFSGVSAPTQYDTGADVTTGFRNLIEDKNNSKVQSMLPIKEAIAVYKERSIYIMTYEGSPSYFVPFQRVPDRGLISPKGVCPVLDGNTHMVVSEDNIFLFDGFTFQVPPIGDRIKKALFADINWSQRHQVFCKAFPQRFEAWIMYPSGSSTNPDAAYCWNWLENAWSPKIVFNDAHNCFMNITGFFDDRKALMGISQDVVELFSGNADIAAAIDGWFRTRLWDYPNQESPHAVRRRKKSQRVEIDHSGTLPQGQIGVVNNLLDTPTYESAATFADTDDGVPAISSQTAGRYLTLKVSDNSTNAAFKIARYKILTSDGGDNK